MCTSRVGRECTALSAIASRSFVGRWWGARAVWSQLSARGARPWSRSAIPSCSPPWRRRSPPGTYRLVTEKEEIPGLSFVAFRRTATLLHLPALPATGATHQVVSVDPVEWAAVVEADGRR